MEANEIIQNDRMDNSALIKSRIRSIDLLRGIVMVIMVLDHSRNFFHYNGFSEEPTDLATTTPALFFTRWITHFCAPVFIFLSGTSIFLMRSNSIKEKSMFVLKRGLWLVLLSLTIVAFVWWFDFSLHYLALDVIWVIGFCMTLFAAIILLPFRIILFFGIICIAFHNLLDNVNINGGLLQIFLWDLFHREALVTISNRFSIFIVYPVMPWIGIMSLGYCFGRLYQKDFSSARRRKILFVLGGGCILLFGFLRILNNYGEPEPWRKYPSFLFTFMSFLNTTKYPPSLLYFLMTIGPSLILLSLTETLKNKIAQFFIVFGRVPLIFYLVHLYFLHIVAFIATLFSYSWNETVQAVTKLSDFPQGYGFSLIIVYLVWIATVFILYPICKGYNKFKSSHKFWWLSYF